MIPLKLRVEVEDDDREKFVVRLRRPDSLARGECAAAGIRGACSQEAYLAGELSDETVFRTDHGYLRLRDATGWHDGDVLFIDAHAGIAHRWLRADSRHNTLLITERCDQLCLMCSQPPKKTHIDQFEALEEAILLAPDGMEIGLSGGEPTLFKDQLRAMLERALTARPDLRFHILTNGQHFDQDDLGWIAQPMFRQVCWGIPVYAADASLHDRIVVKDGAFAQLTQSLAILARANATVELRTVILSQNAAALPNLAEFAARHLRFVQVWALMQLESAGFARRRWKEIFFDHSIMFEPVGDALDIARLRGLPVRLYNFPLCSVPPAYRGLAVRSISDWKQRYAPVCDDCSERYSCAGFFAWHPDDQSYKGLRAL